MSIRLKSSMQTLQYGSEEIMNLTDKTKVLKSVAGIQNLVHEEN
jgi:hypothetical protein